jgi:NADH-quinone oxidoreductase subunit N
MSWNDTLYLLPEIVLATGASILLLVPLFAGRATLDARVAKWSTLIVLLATAMSVVFVAGLAGQPAGESVVTMFAVDGFAVFFKLLFVVIVALVALLSSDFLEGRYSPWEFYSLLTFALTGMFFMASGIHLISIYVGLELLSLSSYILAGYYKTESASTEAAMKYFILGAISSGILLYGISLIYGVCGSLRLDVIAAAAPAALDNQALVFGIMLLGAGLCFKIAAVPFHVWTPDVYVGAPTPITAFLSTGSKAAAFAIFARIFYVGLANVHTSWIAIIAAVSALSIIVGNLAAITQTNVKRMLAYSSIAHAGYGLMGIVAMSELGLYSILVYMFVYAFANLGIWATILMLSKHPYAGEQIDDFEGLHVRAPFLAFAMVIFLLSLGGIPPTAGFIGKYFLFSAAIGAGFGWLAIVAVLMSAVSMFYYLRLVVAMYLKEGKVAEIADTPPLRFAVVICLVVTLLFGILPDGLVRGVQSSVRNVPTVAAR